MITASPCPLHGRRENICGKSGWDKTRCGSGEQAFKSSPDRARFRMVNFNQERVAGGTKLAGHFERLHRLLTVAKLGPAKADAVPKRGVAVIALGGLGIELDGLRPHPPLL